MTPTLRGRRQTRLLLALFVGVPVTLPFSILALITVPFSAPLPYLMLAVVVGIGLFLDGRYDREQQGRWDHDWPVHRQIRAGIIEFLLSTLVLFGPCGGVALLNPGFVVLFPIGFRVWEGLRSTGACLEIHLNEFSARKVAYESSFDHFHIF